MVTDYWHHHLRHVPHEVDTCLLIPSERETVTALATTIYVVTDLGGDLRDAGATGKVTVDVNRKAIE